MAAVSAPHSPGPVPEGDVRQTDSHPRPLATPPDLEVSLSLLQIPAGLQENEVTFRDRKGQHLRTFTKLNSRVSLYSLQTKSTLTIVLDKTQKLRF